MGIVRCKEKQIIAKLRQAELLFAEDKTKDFVCKANRFIMMTLSLLLPFQLHQYDYHQA